MGELTQAFHKWAEDYGLDFEPLNNQSRSYDCLSAFKEGYAYARANITPPLPKPPDTALVPRPGRKTGGTFEADGKIVAEFTTDAGVPMVVFQFDVLPMFHIYRADQIAAAPKEKD